MFREYRPIGHKYKDREGYYCIKIKDGYNGYIKEHRYIMEKILGRKLANHEVVHHINCIRDDNRPENLKLAPNGVVHHRFHFEERKIADRICSQCGSNTTYWNKIGRSWKWTRSKVNGQWLCDRCARKQYPW